MRTIHCATPPAFNNNWKNAVQYFFLIFKIVIHESVRDAGFSRDIRDAITQHLRDRTAFHQLRQAVHEADRGVSLKMSNFYAIDLVDEADLRAIHHEPIREVVLLDQSHEDFEQCWPL